MAISAVDRFRIFGDLIKDGNVANESAYLTVDKLSGALAIKYGDAVLEAHVPDFDITSATNDEKAQAVINWLRLLFRESLRRTRVGPVAAAAGDAESVIVDAEVDSELGTT